MTDPTTDTKAMDLWRNDWHHLAWLAGDYEDVCLNEAASRLYSSISASLQGYKALVPEAECMKQMRETAQEMGYADCLDALEALSEMKARIEALEGALEPFAAMAAAYDPEEGDDGEYAWAYCARPTIGQLRKARAAAALKTKETDHAPE